MIYFCDKFIKIHNEISVYFHQLYVYFVLKLLWCRSRISVGFLWYYRGIAEGFLWDCCEIAVGLL